MSAWSELVKKAFKYNQSIKKGCPKVLTVVDPANNVPSACPVGTLIWDPVNQNAFICTVANTTVVKINA